MFFTFTVIFGWSFYLTEYYERSKQPGPTTGKHIPDALATTTMLFKDDKRPIKSGEENVKVTVIMVCVVVITLVAVIGIVVLVTRHQKLKCKSPTTINIECCIICFFFFCLSCFFVNPETTGGFFTTSVTYVCFPFSQFCSKFNDILQVCHFICYHRTASWL